LLLKLLPKSAREPSSVTLRTKVRFRFTTKFLEVKHGNTAAQTDFFITEFSAESEAGPTIG